MVMRMPTTEIGHDILTAIKDASMPVPCAETCFLSAHILHDIIREAEEDFCHKDWRCLQRQDQVIGPIICCIPYGKRPNPSKLASDPETKQYLRIFNKLHIRRDVLYTVLQRKMVKKSVS